MTMPANQIEQRKEMIATAWLALLVGIIQHFLFYRQGLGISYPLFVAILYGFIFWGLRHKVRHGLDLEYMLIVPIALLSLTFLIYDNLVLHILNFLVIPFLIVAQTMRMGELKRKLGQPFHYFGRVVGQMLVRGFSYFPQPVVLFINRLTRKHKVGNSNNTLYKVVLGLLLTVPFLVVILPLLASADSMFQEQIASWQDLMFKINLGRFLFRLIWILVVTCYVFSFLWGLKYPRIQPVTETSLVVWSHRPEPIHKPISLDTTVALTVLVVINFVYLLFTLVQFSYFFAAGDGVLPDGTNYAEYARRGFAELVLVTMINFSLLLGGIHWIRVEGSKGLTVFLKVMLSLLVGSTIVMLISAHLRLSLYEQAYGYTITRILVHAFMLFLAVLLIISLLRVWLDQMQLLKPFVLVTLVAWLMINYSHIDVMIAKNNLQRYAQSEKIDLAYFNSLSYDIIPYLIKYNKSAAPKPKGLDEFLVNSKHKLEIKDQSWQSFNLAQFRAREALKDVK